MEGKYLLLLLAVAGLFSSVVAYSTVNRFDRAIDAVISVEKANCNPQPLPQCLLRFFSDFNFNGQYPTNESVFDEALHDYVVQDGIVGWFEVRRWMNELYGCVGGYSNFDACVHWQQSMQNFNLTKDEAMDWEVRFRTLAYNIGPAYNVLIQNWYCINQVDLHEDANIKKCQDTFDSEQHDQPNKTCDHVAEYLVCIQRPYAQNCGREVGALACNFERIIYQVTHPECSDHVALHCQGGPSAAPQLLELANKEGNSPT